MKKGNCNDRIMQTAAKNQVGMIIDEHKKLSGFQWPSYCKR